MDLSYHTIGAITQSLLHDEIILLVPLDVVQCRGCVCDYVMHLLSEGLWL